MDYSSDIPKAKQNQWDSMSILWRPKAVLQRLAEQPSFFPAIAMTTAILLITLLVHTNRHMAEQVALQHKLQAAQGRTMPDSFTTVTTYTGVTFTAIAMPWVAALYFATITTVCSALVRGNSTFKHWFALAAHVYIPIALASVVNTVFMWNQKMVGTQAKGLDLSLAVLAPKTTGFVHVLLGSISVFGIWEWGLLVVGFALFLGRSIKASIWVGAVCWVLAILGGTVGYALTTALKGLIPGQ